MSNPARFVCFAFGTSILGSLLAKVLYGNDVSFLNHAYVCAGLMLTVMCLAPWRRDPETLNSEYMQ